MQENNFEKQVHEKLDGLQLNPSENVWLKVEASLKKKKDRRVLVLLLSLFFLAGAGILAYNFYNLGSIQQQPELLKASAPVNSTQSASAGTPPAAKGNSIAADKTSKMEPLKALVPSKKQSSLLVQSPENIVAAEEGKLTSTADNSNKTLLYKTSKIRRYIGAKTAIQADAAIVETTEEAGAEGLLARQHATFNLSGLAFNDFKSGLHLTSNIINRKALALPDVSSKNPAAASRNLTKPNNKISISLEAGTGRSGTANSYLGTIPNNTFYDYNLPQSSSVGGSVTVPDSLRSYNVNPSAVKPGLGFFAGILFTKKISNRSSISAGLRYQLFTTSQSVGTSLTNTVSSTQRQDAVFKAGIGNSYTNNYHLVQIPVEFNTQVSGFKQHNIFAETGISISQLVYSNALQFDNVSRQYFKNNGYFNKTAVGFSAGIFVNLRKDVKPSLLLGPSFQYSFTPLADKGLYAKSHYSFLGLRLQKSLKR